VPPAARELAAGPCTGAVTACVGALLLTLTACGGSDGGAAAPSSSAASSGPSSLAPSSSAPATDDALVVEIDRGDGSAPERYTLTCGDPVAGDLPDPAAACAQLQGLDAPFAPLPADAVCSQQYGGPQTARVTGRWAGEDVDLQLARTNGCQIAQWNRLGALLPGPVG
jgi:Subtilisin inhibitor-like